MSATTMNKDMRTGKIGSRPRGRIGYRGMIYIVAGGQQWVADAGVDCKAVRDFSFWVASRWFQPACIEPLQVVYPCCSEQGTK